MTRTRTVALCLTAAFALSGCKSHSTTTARSTTTFAPTKISAADAIRIAQRFARRGADGRPVIRKPTRATLMSWGKALHAIDSSPDYSLGTGWPVWLVHVYGEFGGPRHGGPPPMPQTSGSTTTTTTTRSPVPPNFYIVLDATSGAVHIENY